MPEATPLSEKIIALVKRPPPSKAEIASGLHHLSEDAQFPSDIEITRGNEKQNFKAKYTLDPEAQAHMERLIKNYGPDYGAFVAMDASTGRILSLVSFTNKPSNLGNLALKAVFPAASVFKVVTATAALDQNRITPDTVIAFNGANHTLYRRNVTETTVNRWTRYMTVREAFAKSVNTVFGKLGIFFLEPSQLEGYARRFKFNENIPADLPVENGSLNLEAHDPWSIAEIASGYNRVSLMSPLQGALMAASVANDGVMMEPYAVEELLTLEGERVYKSLPKITSVTMSKKSAAGIRSLMRETVANGTGRKSFRDLFRRRQYAGIEVGGKSGSLTGVNPRGKCDWFVGYAMYGDMRIAMAALTINERNWKVKSSFLARSFVEHFFYPTWSASSR
ncbi:MAG: penicillin-binding protein [Bdellovibrionales bacterium]|nr:penicillin-binding protein [Bdellovibrionales bacterium]